MARQAQQILSDVLELPEEEQLAIASRLLDHLDGPRDPGWEDAWLDELRKRHADPASLSSEQEWSQVEKRLAERHGRRPLPQIARSI
jgi:hypothetical protein